MKICLIAPLFEPWLLGGAERYATTLAKELSLNHRIVVITSTGPTRRTPDQLGDNPKIIEIEPKNVATVYDINQGYYFWSVIKKTLWHSFDIWNISAYLQIKKILQEEKPDIVHTNAIQGFSFSTFSAIKNVGIPHVHTLHDYGLISRWVGMFRSGKPISRFSVLDRIYMYYGKKMSAKIDAVISPSKFTMNYHEKLGFFRNSKRYIIPNGIKLKSNYSPKTTSGKQFLYVGQIAEHKGLQIAVRAFKKVSEKTAKLHIIGKGSYFETLKKMVEGDNRIILHGFVDGKTLDTLYEQCSYFLLPSIWYENFPLVINEAMSRGLPVISSDIGGIPEIVKEGYNGYLFQAGNTDSLHEIFEKLVNDDKILYKLSKHAIESPMKFSIESQMESIIEVYSKIKK